MNIVLWIIQALLALAFLAAGTLKLTQPIPTLQKRMTWAGTAVPAGLVRFIGLAEVLGAIGLILPAATGIASALTVAATVGIALVMVLAIGFHFSRREYPQLGPNFVLLLLALVILIGRLAWAPLV
jgi:uncharacterized membrane protein YphA (DoxX/SURF4 family)